MTQPPTNEEIDGIAQDIVSEIVNAGSTQEYAQGMVSRLTEAVKASTVAKCKTAVRKARDDIQATDNKHLIWRKGGFSDAVLAIDDMVEDEARLLKHILTDAQVTLLAEALLGTCDDEEAVVSKMFEGASMEHMTHAQHEVLDGITARCEGCGWWLEPDEVDDGFCEDCTVDDGE